MIIPSHLRVPAGLAALSALGGGLVALHYHGLGLTLTHYDARGHLVVARRIFDSITPGWQQIGAVWLPLPHLLNAIPVQVDAWYRSGASAVAISVLSFALAVGSIAFVIATLTDSLLAAAAGTAVFALNPNVLYLQATPMTEPLLVALATLSVALTIAWCRRCEHPGENPAPASGITGLGWALTLACLTRYEAWPLTMAILAAVVWTLRRSGRPWHVALRQAGTIAIVPALAVAGFFLFSRVVVGQWFVDSGFFVPENKALGSPMMATREMVWGLRMLSGPILLSIAVFGGGVVLLRGAGRSWRTSGLATLSLVAMAAVSWAAFVQGHPFRIRYMVPLIAAEAILAGVAVGTWARVRVVAAILLVGVIALELRPLDASAPMVVEAQWDRPNLAARDLITACLGPANSGDKIMASMGSLGHYMQEASHSGYGISNFLHEGNGDIWLAALARGPLAYAEWVLIEEKAEGGDLLAARVREQPHFLEGYARVCEGAGLALYRRTDNRGAKASQ